SIAIHYMAAMRFLRNAPRDGIAPATSCHPREVLMRMLRPEQGGGPDQRPGLARGTLAVRPQRPGIDSGRIGRLSIPEASMPESIPAPLIIDTLKDTFRDARAALAAEGVRPRHEHLGWILSVPDTHQKT